MKERIRILRKELGLTMEKFGSELGLKKNTISQLESGVNNVSEAVINLICKTNWHGRQVNEHWLRTGEGDMFIQLDVEEEIASLIAKIPNEPSGSFKRRFLSVLAGLSEDQWLLLADIVERLAAEEEEAGK